MRAALVTLATLLTAGEVRAQVFTMPVRAGSPRENEPGGVNGTLQPTQPVGLRDCADEEWTFVINYQGSASATRLEYWIGVDQMACATAANRYPVSSGTPRCWPLQQTPSLTYQNPTVPLSYTVRIKSRYLVSPLTGSCTDLQTTQGNIATNYLTLLASPPSDSNIVATYPIVYDIEAPQTPTDVTLSAGENSANVQWTYAGSTTSSTNHRRRRHLQLGAARSAGLLAALRPAAGRRDGDRWRRRRRRTRRRPGPRRRDRRRHRQRELRHGGVHEPRPEQRRAVSALPVQRPDQRGVDPRQSRRG
jgi:hypothetical protein